MSEIQGVKSVNEVAEDDDKNLVSAISNKSVDHQRPEEEEEDHQATNLQNVQETSSEMMRALEDIGKTLDIQQHESKDQTPKRGEVVGRSVVAKKPMSPFAKFRELDRQNSLPSSPSTPKTPGKEFSFKFTDPVVHNNALQIKERLLAWCRSKTKEYENIQIDNFSTSWNNGLAFCALLHHFRPEAFDYGNLKPENRRKNFELAFEKAEEVAGITPLLDVDDMVKMKKPDWKCVFTYVQSIYRRFKDED